MKIDIDMYNVGFGDCFLVSMTADDRKTPYRMLFDCGRHAGSKPTDTDAGDIGFQEVIDRLISDVTDADKIPRIDVIVITHRHRDHVHGFMFKDKWKPVEVGQVWLPWVEDPENSFAKKLVDKQQALAVRTFHALRALSAAAPSAAVDEATEIAYNSTTNRAAMDTLMGGAGFATVPKLQFLPRLGRDPERLTRSEIGEVLPEGLVVHVLGPSRDPQVMRVLDPPSGRAYEPLVPARRELDDADQVPMTEQVTPPVPFPSTARVDAGVYGLTPKELAYVESIAEGSALQPLELVFRLDGAVNGTSLVLLLQIGETKLLFPGDAQWGTWQTMLDNPATMELLSGTTVYKVGHHGSHNATPIDFVEKCLNKNATKAALVSVAPTSYGGGWQDIPLTSLLTALGERTEVTRTDTPADAAIGAAARQQAVYTIATIEATVPS